jgi:hypothetical protein
MRAALLCVACVACKGGGGGTVDAPSGSAAPSITWTFNGTDYSGTLLANATVMNNGAGGNALGIEAADQDGAVMLAIAAEPATPASTIAIGSFDVGSGEPMSTFQLSVGSAGAWSADGDDSSTSGTLTITWIIATEIKGTFEATMAGSGSGVGQLTNGVFDLPVN